MRGKVTPDPAGAERMPRAGGQPIDPAIADQAADWLTVMMAGDMDDTERQRWQRWRDAHPDHERAWRHIEAVTARFGVLDGAAARGALLQPAPASGGRRRALKMLAGVALLGGGAWLGTGSPAWHRATADLRTAAGEQRTLTLPDGTRLTLNTASAVDVRFDDRTRLLWLRAGEIMITTASGMPGGAGAAAAAGATRPLVVRSAEGDIRALGTRFAVRQHDGRTEVSVFEHAVELTPRAAAHQVLRVEAGQRAVLRAGGAEHPVALAGQADAWTRGQIVADDMTLRDFLAELGRYRAGWLDCDAAVAALRFSGVFPVTDTEQVLAWIANTLPVQVRRRTRYWITVEARTG